ncbi:MAG: dual specificity protein phosphatase family protein, partial [Alphaproteobacteria bacterium]|nr:dual specificity protein phosphatase family protein [Alphaproteobacteria bacterium]
MNRRSFVLPSIATPGQMLKKFYKMLEDKERAWRNSFGDDISTPEKRAQARRHFNWVDHGILRVWWTNFYPVAKGVYRSNHPSAERLAAYKAKGIKSVLNLRGISKFSFYLFEKEACDALGLNLTSIHMSATRLPTVERILELEAHF